ncbi:3-oxoacyl-[acyl-carrier-protein] reductase FabG-like isoform X2 [Dermacentor andersoni]|uniref:3-oxoacyl-[acyl-carrier-protein] reductase FabG-like isoform X2 n=1 Tax=Dermacentor andersoni TaxID=34620 RepID=UPI003B3A898F
MPELRGKVALITGASSGIGESTALHFASLGCWLSLTARSKANLERVAEACSQQGIPRDKVLVVPGDVSVEKDVADVVEKTVKHFGKLDILVNNAGITVQKSIQDASLEDFNRVWNTNFLGPLSMIRNAVPHLRQTKGNIVNVSSVASLIVVENLAPYSISKAALDNLTRCAALENAPYGVRVNAINPAVIKTPIIKHPAMSMEDHIKLLQETTALGHALGRVGEPEEVARCIAFLASDDASFVTGITMPVDGGMLLLSSLHPPTPQLESLKTA